MDPEEIDLASLTTQLRARMPPGEPIGYLRGKVAMRDAVIDLLGCSALLAEELVDTLEMRGYAIYQGDPAQPSRASARWTIDPRAGV